MQERKSATIKVIVKRIITIQYTGSDIENKDKNCPQESKLWF